MKLKMPILNLENVIRERMNEESGQATEELMAMPAFPVRGKDGVYRDQRVDPELLSGIGMHVTEKL